MSDFLGRLVDRHTDRQPISKAWLLLGTVVILVIMGRKQETTKIISPVVQTVGAGASGNNVSDMVEEG